ncbi:MAG: Mor transcription activator family protein [Ethanoligenens sp.]
MQNDKYAKTEEILMELKHITATDLKGEQRDLAELIGMETYRTLVEVYGGCNIYIYKADTILRNVRDQEIRNRYTGHNVHELVATFGMSERAVREIVADLAKKRRLQAMAQSKKA